MANYNTFIVIDCKNKNNILITSSARKSIKLLETGYRIDIWNNNKKIETIYSKHPEKMNQYIVAEKEHIKCKQLLSEKRNIAKNLKGVY